MSWQPKLRKLFIGCTTVVGTVIAISVYKQRQQRNLSVYKFQASSNVGTASKWDDNWDRRQPSSLVRPIDGALPDDDAEVVKYNNRLNEKTATATRNLLLIRHGQYDMSVKSDELRILTKLGRGQADAVGRQLKELGHPYGEIISSTMTRARETADIIHKQLPHLSLTHVDCLREGMPIHPEPPLRSWSSECKPFQDGARIEHAFRKYFHRAHSSQTEDSYEIFVCHANVIRYFVCRALQIPPDAWLRLSLRHGSLTWIRILPNGHVNLMMLGDCGNMQPDQLTRM